MFSRCAISTLLTPSAISRKISVSRSVSGESEFFAGSRVRQTGEHEVRNLRIEIRAALRGNAHRFGDSPGLGVFQHVRIGAGCKRRQHLLFEIDHRNDHDARLRKLVSDAMRERDAVHPGQADVDDRDIRLLARESVPNRQFRPGLRR